MLSALFFFFWRHAVMVSVSFLGVFFVVVDCSGGEAVPFARIWLLFSIALQLIASAESSALLCSTLGGSSLK